MLDYVRWLLAEEDEPLTDAERSDVERAEAEIATGNYVTLDAMDGRLDR